MKESKDIFIILLAGLIAMALISGCGQITGSTTLEINPKYKIEGTVLTLALTSEKECRDLRYTVENCPYYIYPHDKGRIRVDKISCEGGRGCDTIKEGTEMDVDFEYSTRPAKISFVPARRVSSGSPDPETSGKDFNTPVESENGYFLYTFEQSTLRTEETVVLPGLKSGSRFRAELNDGKIKTYEAI